MLQHCFLNCSLWSLFKRNSLQTQGKPRSIIENLSLVSEIFVSTYLLGCSRSGNSSDIPKAPENKDTRAGIAQAFDQSLDSDAPCTQWRLVEFNCAD